MAYKDIQFTFSHKGMKKRKLRQKDEQDKQKMYPLKNSTEFYVTLSCKLKNTIADYTIIVLIDFSREFT